MHLAMGFLTARELDLSREHRKVTSLETRKVHGMGQLTADRMETEMVT